MIDDAVPDPGVEPQLASLVPAGTCSAEASGARCAIASLAPGATAVMTVTAQALPSTTARTVANDATVSSATPDSDPSDNTATQDATIGPPVSQLSVAKTADAPSPLIAGVGEVRYTIDVTNTGPSDADPVTVSDVLPADLSVVSASSDRGPCAVTPAPTGDSVSCDLGRLVAPFGSNGGESGRVTIVAGVAADVAAGSYPNVATADAPSSQPSTSPAVPVVVESLANVSVAKSFPQGSNSVIDPGTTETYRIRVVNDGPSAASDVVVSDVLPAGFPPGTFTPTAWRVVAVTPPGPTPTCDLGALTCDLGDLPPDTTIELELDVGVAGTLDPDATVTNTATVTTPTPDPNPGDNTSTFTVSSEPHADLSIRKIPPPAPPIAGDSSAATLANRTFRIEIANFGPAATAFTFTDTLPPGVTFQRIYDFDNPSVDLTPLLNCTVTGTPAAGQTVTCSPPFTLDAFVGVFFGIEFVVDPTVPDGTELRNDISATSAVPDGNPGNNTSTALVPVRAEVNLHVEKQVIEMDANGNFLTDPPVPYPEAQDPLGVPPGRAVSFVVTVTNDGPSAASDVQFVDAFPLDAAYFPVGDCDFLNGETICRDVNAAGDPVPLPPGDSFGVQIITVLDGDTPQGVYANTARASTSTEETTLADNVDARPIEIVDPVADLIISKDDVTSPLVAGESFTYQISVSAGVIDLAGGVLRLSSDANDVVVTDALPDGLLPAAATSSQGSCTVSGQDVRCELGTVESSISLERQVAPTLITVTGRVAPGITGDDATNTATATSSTPLLSGEDHVSDSTTTPITRRADLTVTKVADSPTVAAGGATTFTVTVANAGPSDATASWSRTSCRRRSCSTMPVRSLPAGLSAGRWPVPSARSPPVTCGASRSPGPCRRTLRSGRSRTRRR